MKHKKYFFLWLSTFILACIGFRVYALYQATDYTHSQIMSVLDSTGSRVCLALFIAFCSLPLAILAFYNAKEASRGTKILLGGIVVWLALGLVACIWQLLTA